MSLAHGSAVPIRAALRTASSGPAPVQHAASLPSIATAGTVRMPRLFARAATDASRISSTSTSHELHAMRLTIAIVSSQRAHPALNTSTRRLPAIGCLHTLLSLHPVRGYRVKRPEGGQSALALKLPPFNGRSADRRKKISCFGPARRQSLLPSIAGQDESFLGIADYNFPQRERRSDRKSALLF